MEYKYHAFQRDVMVTACYAVWKTRSSTEHDSNILSLQATNVHFRSSDYNAANAYTHESSPLIYSLHSASISYTRVTLKSTQNKQNSTRDTAISKANLETV